MKSVALRYLNDFSGTVVDWYIGKRCNLNCSYCGPEIHDNHSPHIPYEKMQKIVDTIGNHYNKRVAWSLTGGEPTLHPQFLDLCQHIRKGGSELISVTTNGARDIDYHVKLLELVDGITLSVHFDQSDGKLARYADKIGEIEKQRSNNDDLKRRQFKVRLMAFPQKIEMMIALMEDLTARGVSNIEVRVVKGKRYTQLGDHYPTWYSTEETKQLAKLIEKSGEKRSLRVYFEDDGEIRTVDSNYSDLVLKKQNTFVGWRCWAGLNLLKIAPDGTVYRGSCKVGGALFNIEQKSDEWKLPQTPVTCTKQYCGDLTDLRMPKFRSDAKSLLQEAGWSEPE